MTPATCDAVEVWFKGNSMMVRLLNLTDEADGSAVTGGVTVTVDVLDAGGTLRVDDLALAHVADGDWQATVPADQVEPHIAVGDRLEVPIVVDGGTPETLATWTLHPKVKERRDD